ncbi:MAG: hypothetical protein R6V16_00495 [Bacteroidales bacterium]
MKDLAFFTYLDIINCQLELRRYANQDGRWLAKIVNSDIKDGAVLMGIYGTGKTPDEAIQDYVDQIAGKKLIIDAASDRRREFEVPVFIQYNAL